MLSLVIGGARSGKSRFAQSLCAGSSRVVYLATARAEDAEMAARILRHRNARPAGWVTVEEGLDIAGAVESHAGTCDVILLDCLTLWLSNLCWQNKDAPDDVVLGLATRELARMKTASDPCHVVVVTNEVGCGVVPESALGRSFRDLQGWVNQEAARSADWVHHVVAGIPVAIKQPGALR